MNFVALSGRLARDPEQRLTQSGMCVATFSLVSQRNRKDGKTGKYEADFIRCIAYDKLGDLVIKYYKKGSAIEVIGRMQTRSYEKNGNKVMMTEVICSEVRFAPSSMRDQEPDAENGTVELQDMEQTNDDDLPF